MKAPAMKTPALATVYLDNERVGLMGDPMPRVSKVVAALGKRPDSVHVLRVQSPHDLKGQPVGLEDVIDRTAEPTRPIYLTSKPKAPTAGAARAGMHAPPAVAIESPAADDAGPRPLGSPLPDQPEAEWDP
jgi:hypothetical protein